MSTEVFYVTKVVVSGNPHPHAKRKKGMATFVATPFFIEPALPQPGRPGEIAQA
jgi:hypothetical protein